MQIQGKLRSDIVRWNIDAWGRALDAWDRKIDSCNLRGGRVLDIGAKDGGISLFFALKGFEVVCSDIRENMEQAIRLHREYQVSGKIQYERVDAAKIPFTDDQFDIVTFKSVLGGIAHVQGADVQGRVLAEIHRVLKPGGHLMFAENLRGTPFHAVLRRSYMPNWRYPTLKEMKDLLALFKHVEMSCYGMFSPFGRSERQKSWLNRIDLMLNPFLPASSKLISYGCSEK